VRPIFVQSANNEIEIGTKAVTVAQKDSLFQRYR